MKSEDRELLLKDLSARLPYGVKFGIGSAKLGQYNLTDIDAKKEKVRYGNGLYVGLENCKPYLRPMSSMTKEEKEEYDALFYIHSDGETYCENWEWMDWMNAHHFDYRGLIPMGLALEAQKGMYEIVTTNI